MDLNEAAGKSIAASRDAMAAGDSKVIARFVRLSTMQVHLNGSVSAALVLEMIAHMRELEKRHS